ncbi:MAG: FapA family protein, partial [Planctomycetota bacterium]
MDEQIAPQVEIAEDGLIVSLALPASFERSTLTPESCQSMLEEAGIAAEAFNTESLEKFIAQANAAAPGGFEAVIAEATPAVDGIDAYVKWLVDEPASDNHSPKPVPNPAEAGKDEGDESVCFYSHCVFTLVKAGDVLGKVHHEFPGSDGRDVLGKPIPAKPGKPLEMNYDESIRLNEKNQLIAQLDGVLIHDDHLAWVSDTLEVKENIDFSTGNIDFPGSVVIKQGVKDCFTVKAEADIEVQGLIEAATLVAGNDLRVMGGFAGREQGRAEVQGSLYGRYLDAVTTHIAGDLVIDREVINSNSTILGNIISPTGMLIGGCT